MIQAKTERECIYCGGPATHKHDSYGGGITADGGAEVSDYENVVAGGGLLSNGADRSERGGS
jgi:hypothetical protein